MKLLHNSHFFNGFARCLELVRVFMTERERGNFILDKADFADVAGSYGEKIQRRIK